ncbi:MAG: flavodoxin, partial [Sphaerochaetaceae bacterium]|nr:flavodoxin [Sphaerochaetaceae bacterium]
SSVGIDTEVVPVSEATDDLIDMFDKVAFGCPSMGDEELEDSEFLPFFESIETKLLDKTIALFGSYGWGDGQWMRSWEERVLADNARLFEKGLIVQEAPDAEAIKECREFGVRFAEFRDS